MNACGKCVIVLAVACLWASVIATTITFPLDFWLVNPTLRIRYGMWTLCQDLTTPSGGFLCYSFYDNYTQNSLTTYYKAFQGLQCGMLGFSTIALFLVLINLSFCYKFIALFLIDSILVFLAICCAVVSLLIYGIKIYDPNSTIIGWCFWLSVGSGGLLVISLLLLTLYLIVLGHSNEKAKKMKKSRENEANRYDFGTTKSIPSYRQAQQQQHHKQQDVYPPDDPGSRYVVREAEYRNSNRWREPPATSQAAYYPYETNSSYNNQTNNNATTNTINRNNLSTQNSNPNWTYTDSASMTRYKIARSQV